MACKSFHQPVAINSAPNSSVPGAIATKPKSNEIE
jgi:hypothetical protein